MKGYNEFECIVCFCSKMTYQHIRRQFSRNYSETSVFGDSQTLINIRDACRAFDATDTMPDLSKKWAIVIYGEGNGLTPEDDKNIEELVNFGVQVFFESHANYY